MTKWKVPEPVSAGLILSYKCPARCRHCMYACSPHWEADWISTGDLQRGLTQLAGRIQPSPWGRQRIGLNHGLHFSGGEPFMNFELLLKAVEMAEELQIPSTFVETNCYWCTDDKTADERLKRLKEAGLKGILISVNPYYAEFVPFERTERCIEHSLRIFGENVAVYQLEYYRRFKQLGIKKRISVEEYTALTRDESLAYNVEMFLMGRATQELRGLYPTYSASVFVNMPCQPTFIRNWHNHFDNFGNYMPGFCGGISLGNWYEMDKLTGDGIELEEKPVLKYLVEENFKGLYGFAEDFGYRESREGYLSKCDLCLDIRKFLVSQSHFDELQPREFYEQLTLPETRQKPLS